MNTPALRFGLKFIMGFLILMGSFEAARGTHFEQFVVQRLILIPTAIAIDVVTPAERVTVSGRTIVSPDGANLRVVRGCEGIEMFLLLIAAILAFPASWRQRGRGLLLGCLLAYVLSIARLMALHYILRYSPQLWEALHGLILPLAPIVLLSLYFSRWSASSLKPDASGAAAHAA